MVVRSVLFRFLITAIASVVTGVAVFLCISLWNASDPIVFSIVAGVAVSIAVLASPNLKLAAGLHRLWLFDWIVAAVIPVPLVLFAVQEGWFVRLVRYLVLFAFFISGSVVFRRILPGKGKEYSRGPE